MRQISKRFPRIRFGLAGRVPRMLCLELLQEKQYNVRIIKDERLAFRLK